MTGARLAEVWLIPGDKRRRALTDAEQLEVMREWDSLDGGSCWEDAFHSLWRKMDPAAHAVRFVGTFYATAESMRDEDVDESACGRCGGVDLTMLGQLGTRRHFRCRDCGGEQSRAS